MAELAELFFKRTMKQLAMRGAERAVTEAVISAFKGDHAGFAGGEVGGLQRSLDGLKAGVAKNGFAVARQYFVRQAAVMHMAKLRARPTLEGELGKFARELTLERVRVHIAHRVRQLGELRLSGFGDARVGMAGGGHGKGTGEVEILFAVRIPNVYTLCVLPDNRPGAFLRKVSDIAALVLLQEFEVGFIKRLFGPRAKCVCVAVIENAQANDRR